MHTERSSTCQYTITPGPVARVPLGHAVLVPRAELLGIARTRGRRLTPQGRVAHREDRVTHPADGGVELLGGDVLSPDVQQIVITVPAAPAAHPLDARVGAQPVHAWPFPRVSRGAGDPIYRQRGCLSHCIIDIFTVVPSW